MADPTIVEAIGNIVTRKWGPCTDPECEAARDDEECTNWRGAVADMLDAAAEAGYEIGTTLAAPVEVLEDALCRREWAAALRWAKGEIGQMLGIEVEEDLGFQIRGLSGDDLDALADRIECGALTPWADSAERDLAIRSWHARDSDPKATRVDAATPPADAGPHPDTPPHAYGILGRALLDADGDLWPKSPSGPHMWRVPSGKARYGQQEVEVVTVEPPAREVLLVDPAAADVIEAAQQWREYDRAYAVQDTAGPLGDLAAAVDALTGGTEHAEVEPEPVTWRDIHEAMAAGEPVIAASADVEVVIQEQPAEPAPEPPGDCAYEWCDCAYEWWGADDDYHNCHEPAGHNDDHVCPCGAHRMPLNDAAPEPAGDGRGWDRTGLDRLLWYMRDQHLDSYAKTVEELFNDLLADRDQLERDLEHARADRQDLWDTRDKRNHRWMEAAERYQTETDRDAVRAELAESRLDGQAWDRLAAEAEQLRSELNEMTNARDEVRAQLAEVTAERDSWRAGAELAESRVDELRAELATGRRDAAADALDYGAGWIRRVFADGIDPEVAKCLDALAYRIRAGHGDVPGSPQPADEGGQDG